MKLCGVDVQFKKLVRKKSKTGELPVPGDEIIVWGSIARLGDQELVVTCSSFPHLQGAHCVIKGANYLTHWCDAIAEFTLTIV